MHGFVCRALAILGVVAVPAGADATAPVFQGLGSLHSGPYFFSEAFGVSPDGRVVLGRTRVEDGTVQAAYWTQQTGWVLIGDLPGGDVQSRATASSTDGSIIVGVASQTSGTEAFIWTAEAGIQGLGDLPGGVFWSEALEVSADGRVVVGQSHSGSLQAIRWQRETGMQGLGFLPGATQQSVAYDVSADGSTIVGRSHLPTSLGGAFRWTAATGMQDLGMPPSALRPLISLNSISPDGLKVAGQTSAGSWAAGFRWDFVDDYEIFQPLESSRYIAVHAMDAKGRLIVGSSSTQTHNEEAFVWDEVRGVRSLRDILESDYGVDLTGWQKLYLVSDVSDDGRVIVGQGYGPRGGEGWIVTFSNEIEVDIRPGSSVNRVNLASPGLIGVALLGSESFDVSEVDATTLAFGPDAATPVDIGVSVRDVDGDSVADLLAFYRIGQTGIAYGDIEACVMAETLDGRRLDGCDSIVTVGACGNGFGLALIVPPLVGAAWIGRRRAASRDPWPPSRGEKRTQQRGAVGRRATSRRVRIGAGVPVVVLSWQRTPASAVPALVSSSRSWCSRTRRDACPAYARSLAPRPTRARSRCTRCSSASATR